MNIEDVKGILIDRDGGLHPFGKNVMAHVKDMSDDNFHESSFKKDVLPTSWFKGLNYDYNGENIFTLIDDLSMIGIVGVLNCSSLTANGEEFISYAITTPSELSSEQKKVFSDNYEHLKELLDGEDRYFEAEGHDKLGNYCWDDNIYSLDEFYDKLEIDKKIKGKVK